MLSLHPDVRQWRLVLVTLLLIFSACKNSKSNNPPPANPFQTNCSTSGGQWSGSSCLCPSGTTLRNTDGFCSPLVTADTTSIEGKCQAAAGTWDANLRTCNCGTGRRWDGATCVQDATAGTLGTMGTTGDPFTVLQQACSAIVGASFDPTGSRCVCPTGQALVGRTCQVWNNIMTQGMCETAIFPGQFQVGQCLCQSGLAFAAERGGCPQTIGSPNLPGTTTTFDVLCAQAGGIWDNLNMVCNCNAPGYVLTGRTCQPGSAIPGQETALVCVTAIFPGSWTGGRCSCGGSGIVFDARRGGCSYSQGAVPVLTTGVVGTMGTLGTPGTLGTTPNVGNYPALCATAGGTWDYTYSRCTCAANTVVLSGRCTAWSGIVNAGVCASTLAPGTWNGSACVCGNGVGFSPPNGGCLGPATATVPTTNVSTSQQQLCQGSGGNWIFVAMLNRYDCQCPAGSVYVGSVCQR